MPLVLTDQSTPDLTVLTLNNPARLNALSIEMVEQLHVTLDELAESAAAALPKANWRSTLPDGSLRSLLTWAISTR